MAENIATLQKVALVRNIPFDKAQELSNNYPFALIFGEGDPTSITAPVIFQGGYRYTRFINVDPERKEVQVNDHTIVLYFNYETGLLSIGDKYVLNDINLIRLSYIPFFGTNEVDVYNGQVGNFIIDAKDNKFKIEFRFITDDEDETKYISKELSFGYNEYIKYVGYNENSLGTTGIYYFNVLKTCNNLILTGKSTYASNIVLTDPYNINNLGIEFEHIKLNPQYLHIYEDGINIDNKDTLTLNYDEEINLKAILSCDAPNAVFNNFDIRINNMPSFINVVQISASSNEATFNIKCANIDINASLNGSFDINVYRDNELVSHLSKHYKLEVHGEYNDALWYIGDIEPELLSQNDLMTLNGNIGFEPQDYPSNIYAKYFVISTAYDGVNNTIEGKVRPCNNFYTINGNTDNQKFVSAANWVEEYTSIEINDITFNVYRFKDEILYENKFYYGKIQ